jgi:uncharacterized membrane protein HdeD (DUF308 family)
VVVVGAKVVVVVGAIVVVVGAKVVGAKVVGVKVVVLVVGDNVVVGGTLPLITELSQYPVTDCNFIQTVSSGTVITAVEPIVGKYKSSPSTDWV